MAWTFPRIRDQVGIHVPRWSGRVGGGAKLRCIAGRVCGVEALEQRALLSVGGIGSEQGELGGVYGPVVPSWEGTVARLTPSPERETAPLVSGAPVGEGTEADEAIGSWLLADLDAYVPMPLPDASQSGTSSGVGYAVSYDCLTGEETICETSLETFLESNSVPGGLGAIAELLSGIDPNAEPSERGFTSLTRVDNPELSPWRVNCKVFMSWGDSNYVASGVLIDPMHVLTAGHCVYDDDLNAWADSITVVPAYTYGEAQPYGEAHSVQLHSWTGWTGDGDYDDDIGVIDLDRPIGALTGWNGYGYNTSESFFLGNTFYNPSYPAESPYNGRYMYDWHGDFDYFIPFGNQVGITQDGYGGQSGSGANHTEDGSRYVYAVLSNGTSGFENFVRLTEGKFEDIRDSFIPADVPSTVDLIPLDVNVPATVNSGSALSSMTYVVHNYSSASWSGTVSVDVYLSTNNDITTSDTLLQSHTFTKTISAKGTTTITVSTPPTIPVSTATGDYYIGVIITTSDYSAGNNDTDGWDAAAIHVNHVNQAPVLSALPNVNLNEDATLNNTIDLWSYVSDLETADGSLTYSIVANTNTSCGVSIDSSRYIDVAPTANWNGYSDVTVRVTDPSGAYDDDTFRITVAAVNDAPVWSALPDVNLNEDASLNNTIDLWAYAADAETSDGSLTYSIAGNTNTSCGVSIDSARYIDVAPTANWNGTSDVTIRVTDPQGAYTQDTFRITVAAVNDAPVAVNDAYTTPEDTALVKYAAEGVRANDTDVENTTLEISLVSGPLHGTLTLGTNGYITYQPAANYYGADSFTYRAYDGALYSNTATVTLQVTPVNDAPAAVNDAYATPEDTALVKYSSEGVRVNDTDAENTTLEISLVSGPLHGTLTLGTNGYITYQPAANYHGTDSFTYRAYDGELYSNTATVTLQIVSVNDAPVAVGDSYSCDMGTTLTKYSSQGVLVNDTDVDNNDGDLNNDVQLQASVVSGPAHGALTLGTNGYLVYDPEDSFYGTDSFTYRAWDTQAYSSAATVVINVLPKFPGDANRSGTVDQTDAAIVAAHWGLSGMTWADGDFNGDGVVGAADASILAANWGHGVGEAAGDSSGAAADAALVEEYGPQARRANVDRCALGELAWSSTAARRNRLAHDEDGPTILAPAVDLLMAVDDR